MLTGSIKLRTKIRWSTAAFFFLSGIISATWASRIPEVQQKFNLSDAQWGGVLFALPVGLVIGLPISSWLIETFTSARMMTVEELFLPCCFSLCAWLLTFYPLLSSFFVLASPVVCLRCLLTQILSRCKTFMKNLLSHLFMVYGALPVFVRRPLVLS